MNRQLYILTTILCAVLFLGSCRRSDLDKLPPASERSSSTINETIARLEGHQGYWRLIYYPEDRRSYGGYSMYVRFERGQVSAISELDTEEETSSYDVQMIDMPTLAFSTRNPILHHFSTATEYFRNARGGDFELLLMGMHADTILLEGRKHHNQMRLEPMTTDPRQEVQAIQAVHQLLSGKGLTSVNLGTSMGVSVSLHPTYRQLVFTEPADTTIGRARAVTHRVPFRYTPEGLRFYQPFELGGVSLSYLNLNEARTALVSPELGIEMNLVNPPIDLMNARYQTNFTRGVTNSATTFQASLRAVSSSLNSTRSTTIDFTPVYFGVNTNAQIRNGSLVGNDTPRSSFVSHTIYVESSYRTNLAYEMDFVGVGSDPTLLDIVQVDGNESTYWYYYEVNGARNNTKSWINLLSSSSPYRVESREENGQTIYRLTSTRRTNYWFDLSPASI